MSLNPFDIVKNINKKDGLIDSDEIMTSYAPFIINKNFSGTIDTLFIANEANKFSSLPKEYMNEMLYRFYYGIVEKSSNRFANWLKQSKNDDREIYIDAIAEYYKCSKKKANDLIEVHTDNQLNEIVERTNKGGRK